VLSQELDVGELLAALRRMQAQQLTVCPLARPGPLAFPLMVERFREKLSNEALADRIARMLGDLEAAADTRGPAPPVRVQDVVPPDPPLRPRRRRAGTGPAPAADGPAQDIAAMLDFGVAAAGEADAARPARTPRRKRPSRPLPRL